MIEVKEGGEVGKWERINFLLKENKKQKNLNPCKYVG